MTVNELYRQGCDYLEEAQVDNAAFDARCMLEKLMKVDTSHFLMLRDSEVDTRLVVDYLGFIRRRVSGEPLQYILGEWEFMGNTFEVGKGVLIPRPETELLVEFAVRFLSGKKEPVVFDLCSGSGCIAVSVAKICKNSKVFAIEKSPEAFSFLKKNVKINRTRNVTAILGDICDTDTLKGIKPDLIISNPPYIKTDEIPLLQREVRQEPAMALDGGNDGYDFYRIITEKWLDFIAPGGAIAVECAEDQAEHISDMFTDKNFSTEIINDLSGFPRIVVGYANRK